MRFLPLPALPQSGLPAGRHQPWCSPGESKVGSFTLFIAKAIPALWQKQAGTFKKYEGQRPPFQSSLENLRALFVCA